MMNTVPSGIVLLMICIITTSSVIYAQSAPDMHSADTKGMVNEHNKMKKVNFKNRNITMVGNLFQPSDFNEGTRYPAIIVVHPSGGVKEQTAGAYAERLAEAGFVTLAFDASYQGESGGEPRFLDLPMNRVEDVFSAVDYLTTLSFVDIDRIGILGICAGGGYAVKASSLDRRIKVVATASATNVGSSARKGWDGKTPISALAGTLEKVANQRTEEAGSEATHIPYLPKVGEATPFRDMREGADYYLTPRGQHPNAPNKMLNSSRISRFGFDAFDLVDPLLTQPILIAAGTEAESLWHSQELYAKAPEGNKELFLIEGKSHMDLYDGEGREIVLGKIIPFFKKKL